MLLCVQIVASFVLARISNLTVVSVWLVSLSHRMLVTECRHFYCLIGLLLLACSSCLLLVSLLLAVLLILVLRMLTADVAAGSFLLRAVGALLLLSCCIQCQVGDGRCSAERLYPIEAISESNELVDFARGLPPRICTAMF